MNDLKKNKIILMAAVLLAGILFLFRDNIISGLFSAQYNSNGVSHFLVVTKDESQQKEYVGKLDDHSVFMEKLDIEETNFRTRDAKNLSVKEAIDKNLVSIDEWEKYAWKIKKDGPDEILQFDNYEIVVSYNECTIRPIT